MSDTLVSVENVSKKFCRTLKRSLWYGVKDIGTEFFVLRNGHKDLRKEEFWALRDVSLELRRGETLGLMGLNGAGKTTLLRMLNGLIKPDAGRIEVRGRVQALIALGAGFNPILTGRENIYVNAAVLGFPKSEVDRRFDEIVDFSGIEEFIDTPVQNYSSGMVVRLGFAVAIHMEPDILLLDEVLAVGDRNFRIKCFRKMHELKKNIDVSIVLVSHNEYTMRQWVQKCIVLNKGRIVYSGKGDEGISYYINNVAKENKELSQIEGSFTNEGVIKNVTCRDGTGNQTNIVRTGDKLIIDFDYETERKIISPIFGINISNSGGLFTGFWNSYNNVKLQDISGKGTVRVTVNPLDLPVDIYRCAIVLCEEEESNVLEWKDLEQTLIVERPHNTRGFFEPASNLGDNYTMKILFYAGGWPTNIGNAFIDCGAIYTIKWALPNAKIYFASELPRWFFKIRGENMDKSIDLAQLIETDVLMVSGMVFCKEFIELEGPIIQKLSDKGIKIVFNGCGGANYDKVEVDNFKRFLEKINVKGFISRDEITYNNFKDSFPKSFNGMDCAFFLSEAFNPASLTIKDYVVYNFDQMREPKIDENNKTIIRTHHSCSSFFPKYTRNRGKIFSLVKQWPFIRKANCRYNDHNDHYFKHENTLISDIRDDYLNLYANAYAVYSDRVHACIAALAFGNFARLYSSTPRASIFDARGVGKIREKLVRLDENKISIEKERQISFLREILNQA